MDYYLVYYPLTGRSLARCSLMDYLLVTHSLSDRWLAQHCWTSYPAVECPCLSLQETKLAGHHLLAAVLAITQIARPMTHFLDLQTLEQRSLVGWPLRYPN